MVDSKKLTKSDVDYLARLSMMEVDEPEANELIPKLEATLGAIENLEELETAKVLPTFHTSSAINVAFEDGSPSPRTLDTKDVFANSPTKPVGNKFVSSRILHK